MNLMMPRRLFLALAALPLIPRRAEVVAEMVAKGDHAGMLCETMCIDGAWRKRQILSDDGLSTLFPVAHGRVTITGVFRDTQAAARTLGTFERAVPQEYKVLVRRCSNGHDMTFLRFRVPQIGFSGHHKIFVDVQA